MRHTTLRKKQQPLGNGYISTSSGKEGISKYNLVHRYQGRSLLIAINALASLSIFFFGYDQGMMGGVNNARNYYETTMKIGYQGPDGAPVITNALRQGGIVAIYYLGTLCSAFVGGWFCDRYGRIKTIALGAAFAIFGACFQCSAMNHTWMIFARLLTGFGTGFLNVVVPIWSTETAEHTSRGLFVSIEFTLNIFGVVVAYWLEYGCSFYGDGDSSFVWRFPIAFQIVPLIVLLSICGFFPESPRWLAKMGRMDEARYVLGRLRGETEAGQAQAEKEFNDIIRLAEMEEKDDSRNSYFFMLTDFKSKLHLGRRVQLVVWLQIVQEWVGIAGVTVYAPTIFRIAGISNEQSQWVSGLNNVTYMFATLICVFTLDRIGRRWTLYWGSIGQGFAMFLAGGLSRLGTDRGGLYGNGAVAMIYLFTAVFGATWLTVPWLYPAEIFPLSVRAKGNAWGVIGWSIGNGWLTLLCPVMFNAIGEKTLYIFGICNILSIPMVWALYPETNQRSLEEIDLLFSSDSPFVWAAEAHFEKIREEHPELVQGGKNGGIVDVENVLDKI